jgi:hypothetical protein
LRAEAEQIEAVGTVTAGVTAAAQGSRLSALARDVATMSGGTALAAVFNTLLVFLIPRLVSVEDFGYWRLFLLYASFVGFLHMGFADGALLRWAGRPLDDFRHEIGPSMNFLFWQHLVFVVPAGVIVALLLRPPLGFLHHAKAQFSHNKAHRSIWEANMLMSHSVAHDILPASLSKSDNALVSIRRSSSRIVGYPEVTERAGPSFRFARHPPTIGGKRQMEPLASRSGLPREFRFGVERALSFAEFRLTFRNKLLRRIDLEPRQNRDQG